MKNKIKIISTLTIMMLAMLIIPNTAKAVLQSNGNTPTTKLITNWMINIRQMETLGGTLGLTETLNGDLTSSSGSNNLDIHMEKNGEYGAIAILSASSYGNPNKIENGGTTTGNETGIVMNINNEMTASIRSTIRSTDYFDKNVYYARVANAKYISIYNYNGIYVAVNGDAISETAGWHNSTISEWFNSDDRTLVYRSVAGSNSIFSYSANLSRTSGFFASCYARAIMIVGEGI